MNLGEMTVGELLSFSRGILAELRRRGVIRTGNAPAGDYAELLVQRATDGELAPNSQKSWDVLTSEGERLQIKARVVTDPRKRGERQLSVGEQLDLQERHAWLSLLPKRVDLSNGKARAVHLRASWRLRLAPGLRKRYVC
jgi:hypothetical protein